MQRDALDALTRTTERIKKVRKEQNLKDEYKELAETCVFDEAYSKDDAFNIGWCGRCECDGKCICKRIVSGKLKYPY